MTPHRLSFAEGRGPFGHADPLRAELDLRWRDDLEARTEHSDHGEWMSRAASECRDEIVHLCAQLLNDRENRPWDGTRARLASARYLEDAREYDKIPSAWDGLLVGSAQTLAIGSS